MSYSPSTRRQLPRSTPARVIASAFAALMSAQLAADTLRGDSNVPVFTEPPPPQTLARQLFGPRYRGGADMFAMLIQFEFDSTTIEPQSLPLLESVGEMMLLPEVRGRRIVVEGHTDSTGAADYNNSLSIRRARAVIDYLSASFGIPAERFAAVGKGEREPYDTHDSTAPVNRRAVFRAAERKIRLK